MHQKGFINRTINNIKEADLIIQVLDARFPHETRNKEMEKIIRKEKKQIIYLINKTDLITDETAKKIKKELEKYGPTIFISAKAKKGIIKLKEEIGKLKQKKKIKIAITGYPNVGKSTTINALSRKKKVKTSPKAGYTRGEQYVKISEEIILIDLPGVIPKTEKDQFKLFLIGSKNPNQLEDQEEIALKLIKHYKENNMTKLEEYFQIKIKNKNEEEILKEIGEKRNIYKKQGEIDIEKTANYLLREYEKHKI